MRRLLALAILFGLVLTTRAAGLHLPSGSAADGALVLGFMLFVSWQLGELVARIKLPRITGYLVAGVLCGPFVLPALSPRLELLSRDSIRDLEFIDAIALGLIAFTAGGELKLETVRRCWRGVLWITAAKVVFVLVGVTAVLVALGSSLSIFAGYDARTIFAISLLFATIAVAKSPATTIAVINEYRPHGPVTDITLGVTVIKDIIVVMLFAVALSSAKIVMSPQESFDAHFMLVQVWEIGGSLAGGVGLGWLLARYIQSIRKEMGLVVLALAFLAIYVGESFHLSGLLVCMVAGFVVENYSRHGDELIQAVERHSLPVYIVFFTLAGAALDLKVLASCWEVALLLAGLRLAFTALGTYVGARLAQMPRSVRVFGWMGFLGQAGLSLSFARKVAETMPDESGQRLYSVLIAVVAINQLIGPALFRFGLSRSGEIGSDRDTEVGA